MRPQRNGIGGGCLPNPNGCHGGGSRAAYDHYNECCAPVPSQPCAHPDHEGHPHAPHDCHGSHHPHEPDYPPEVPVPPGRHPGRAPGRHPGNGGHHRPDGTPPPRQPTGNGHQPPGGPHDWYRDAPTAPPPRPTGPHGGPHDQYRSAPMPQPPQAPPSGIGSMGRAVHRKYMKGLGKGAATTLTARRVRRQHGVTGRVR